MEMEKVFDWSLRALALALVALLALLPAPARSQTYAEDFTGASTQNNWYFSGGACLTAGSTTTSAVQPGNIVNCATALTNYYSHTQNNDPKLVGGNTGTLPDTVGNGALRFTNGSPYGFFQAGSIVSGFAPFPTSQGVTITFKTVTYLGSADGMGGDGADGISFFLMDGCVPLAGASLPSGCGNSTATYGSNNYTPIGSTGGSLGYTCSNRNNSGDGLPGGYLGLGVDEYGNFLNGTNNTLNNTNGTRNGSYPADNTLSGGYYQPGRIGLRGAGSINWQQLNFLYNTNPGSSGLPYYPTSMASACTAGSYNATLNTCGSCSNSGTYNATNDTCSKGSVSHSATQAQQAVYNTCANATLYNYSSFSSPTVAGSTTVNGKNNKAAILDYQAIPGGWTTMPTADPIAAEKAMTRGAATPITYNLNITQDGKLSFSLSYNGGTTQNIITNQDITASNGPLPTSFRFGFAGSTGGSTNVHEILCFKAAPNELSLNSGGVSDFESPEINLGTQLFLGSYFPTKAWAGSLTAQTIGFDTTKNSVVVASKLNWDASCVLTGGACPSGAPAGPAGGQASRTMLTWNSQTNSGEAFESPASNGTGISSQQNTAIDGDDPNGNTGLRLQYLRGSRKNEIPNGLGLYRTRTSVLGDIIDSSPTMVGAPSTYPTNMQWVDLLNTKGTSSMPENTGESYQTFQGRVGLRQNVVYVGANDGFLHGFAAGAFDASTNTFITASPTLNDGHEVLAYMPGAISMIIHNTATPQFDYSGTQYNHQYFVDATPGTGDVMYGGLWHTWLVGGFGSGAAGIYMLDVTDPTKFQEASPAATVIGEWTPTTISGGCGNASSCGDSMGTISGIPLIRRFHTGQWGFIFGNGLNSASGDAGIFVALIDSDSGKPSLLYFSAQNATKQKPGTNGIVSVAAADIDSDHIVDFVYAGDIQGNVWRWDLTGTQSSQWKISGPNIPQGTLPIFHEPNGMPITTAITVSTLRTISTTFGGGVSLSTRKPERIIINFGTGQQIPQANDLTAQYMQKTGTVYGIWDSNFVAWNGAPNPPIQPVVSLTSNIPEITGVNQMQAQSIKTQDMTQSPPTRKLSTTAVCFADTSGCTQYGWFLPLHDTNEQLVFDPIISPDGALIVNTFVPAATDVLSCTQNLPTGWTMAMEPDTGTGTPTSFFAVNSGNVDGVQLNGTGVPALVMSGQSSDQNAQYLITQTSGGAPATPTKTNHHVLTLGQRMNWIERR
jgi:type IV pilus assembly protein PilY1